MSLVICRTGLVAVVQQLKAYFNTLTLRLYQNNHTPADTDTAASYTEATFAGYAAVALGSWSNAFLNSDNYGETDETTRVFTCTGSSPANTIYGYYITDGSGNLIWAEINPAGSFLINTAAQTYTVLPRWTLRNP